MTLTHYNRPLKKITVTHGGTVYQLEDYCPKLDIAMEENAAWTADITLTDQGADFYSNKVTYNDRVQIYSNYGEVEEPLTAASLRFDGFVEDISPVLSQSGEFLNLKLRSYSRCLLDLICGAIYGTYSNNTAIDTVAEILTDTNGIIPLYVNHLMGDVLKDSGYTLNTSEVQAITGNLQYIDFPFKPVKGCIDDLLDLLQGLKGSSTAGGHWIVKPEEAGGIVTNYLIFDTVGNHSSVKWPTWWNTDETGSTIAVKQDMIIQQFTKQRPESNYILYAGNFRKPGDGDYWTENSGGAALWASCVHPYEASISDSAQWYVGNTSLLLEPVHAPTAGYAYFPSNHDADWDFTSLSTPSLIPKLCFFMYADYVESGSPVSETITLATNWIKAGDVSDDYFMCSLTSFMSLKQDKWIRVEIPIGPYWALDPSLQKGDETSDFEWLPTGTADWSHINLIGFGVGGFPVDSGDNKYIDGLHFGGHLIRVAKKYTTSLATVNANAAQKNITVTDGTLFRAVDNVLIQDDAPASESNQIASITGNVLTMVNNLANNYTTANNAIVIVNDYYKQKVITDQVAKDDSLHASDGSGTMAQIAYAELLRSCRSPIMGSIVIPAKPIILPGQKAHIHAVATTAGGYRIDKDMRITLHQLSLSEQGFTSTLTLTDDLINGRALTPNSMFNIIRKMNDVEYQNRQMSSVKTWALDLSQARLEKTYSIPSSY